MSAEIKPGYKQTEAGVIPEAWEARPLLSVVRLANGQVDPTVEPYKSMPLIAPDHIASGTGTLLKIQTAEEQGAISGKYLFSSGDIIYSKIRPYLKKAVHVDFVGLCSADMYPMTPLPGVSASFVLPVLLGHRFSSYAETVSVRSGMPKINREELACFSIALPPAEEQECIGSAFSDMDALISSLDQLIAKQRDIQQATMQQLFTGQRRLPGFSGEWEVKPMRALGSTYGGLAGKTKSDFGHGDARYIPFMNVMTDTVIDANWLEHVDIAPDEIQNLAKKGDLFFNGSSETPEEVGFCSVLLEDIPSLYLNSFCFGFRFNAGAKVNGLFFAYWFRSKAGRAAMSVLAQGATRYNIAKSAFMQLEIPQPSEEEQTAIATILSDMDAALAALEARRDKARQLKQGMMQELLTGRIRLV